ncbi:MAG: phosphotransferase [Pirellulaceae bacterium]|jgi:hypothetical protein|nr:phosphotransferase [Pirellulaceae bacterium]MDP7020097.1 phosphotransferase [Pirellulaceae bacterium]
MFLLTPQNVVDYLCSRGVIDPTETPSAGELTGGVSGAVYLISRTVAPDLVVKQSREQLRVEERWVCSPERIWRECAVLRLSSRLLAETDCDGIRLTTPQLIDEDRENYAYTMTAAADHDVWKSRLLAGEADGRVAAACGAMLGQLHAASWRNEEIAAAHADRGFFLDLRVDPYYRHVARTRPTVAPAMEQLEESLAANRCALVHGDFSPKNLLVNSSELVLLDFEVGHWGDPAFDLGFFGAHLCLKSYWAPTDREADYLALLDEFWTSYRAVVGAVIAAGELAELERRAVWNTAGCGLARLDGKSLVDYLADSEPPRRFFDQWVATIAPEWDKFRDQLGDDVNRRGELGGK